MDIRKESNDYILKLNGDEVLFFLNGSLSLIKIMN